MIVELLCVSVGAVLGALLRFATVRLTSEIVPGLFPWGTLAVNLVGCFAIGVSWGISQGLGWSAALKAFVFIGLLGSFTTFSSFGLETLNLARGAGVGQALLYVVLSNLGGFTLAWLGLGLSRPLSA